MSIDKQPRFAGGVSQMLMFCVSRGQQRATKRIFKAMIKGREKETKQQDHCLKRMGNCGIVTEEAELLKSYFSSSYCLLLKGKCCANINAGSLTVDGACIPTHTRTISRNMACLQIRIVKELIKNYLIDLNEFKSFRADELHPKLLKELADILSQPLSIIFEKFWTTRK